MVDIPLFVTSLQSLKTATEIVKFIRESDVSLEKAELIELLADARIKKGSKAIRKSEITTQGRPLHRIEKGFNAAVKRAGIEDFTFHDLRHRFASQMIMRGASLKEVQEILGHKTIAMTMRYAHLSQEQKKKAVNLFNGLTTSAKTANQNVTNTSHFQSQASI